MTGFVGRTRVFGRSRGGGFGDLVFVHLYYIPGDPQILQKVRYAKTTRIPKPPAGRQRLRVGRHGAVAGTAAPVPGELHASEGCAAGELAVPG